MDTQILSKKANLLHLNSMAIADGMKTGTFRSLFSGRGIDFSGVREYLRGDDVRSIDWNVTARMGKPYIKVFEEERELDVFILLDRSPSMATSSTGRTRSDIALEASTLLTLASLNNSSPVGAVIFDGRIQFSCAPKSGRNHALYLVSQYEKKSVKPENGSCLTAALRGARNLLKKHTLVFVISDFRTSGWSKEFACLARKNDVVAVRITDPFDEKLPAIGAVALKDTETDYECVLPTSNSKFQRHWRNEYEKRAEHWKNECLRHGGIPFSISTAQDPAQELIRFFDSRERK